MTSEGLSVLDAASAVTGDTAAASDRQLVIGPEVTPIVLTINSVSRTVKVEPRMTLAEALRGPFGLTGTKIACNRGACSACTVWLDGVPSAPA